MNWKKILFRSVVAILVLLALAIGIGFLLPSSYFIERSITINAAPQNIHPYVNSLKKWTEWTTWNQDMYPNLEFAYEGPKLGKGAIETFTEPEMGSGRLEITESNPLRGIKYELTFEAFEHPLLGEIKYESASDDSTNVIWSGRGELGNNPIGRYFGLMFDSMIGGDYETGLAKLKQLAEANSAVE